MIRVDGLDLRCRSAAALRCWGRMAPARRRASRLSPACCRRRRAACNLTGPTSPGCRRAPSCAAAWRLFRNGASCFLIFQWKKHCLPAAHAARDRRLFPRNVVYDLFPRPGGTAQTGRRVAIRRRAADAGDRTSACYQSEGDAARRAVGGPRRRHRSRLRRCGQTHSRTAALQSCSWNKISKSPPRSPIPASCWPRDAWCGAARRTRATSSEEIRQAYFT